MSKTLKEILKWTVTLLLVVVSVYFAIQGVRLEELIRILKNANYIWAILPIPIIITSHYIRALRWRTILTPIYKPKSTLNLFSAVMVGYFFNMLTPRGGELVRPYIFAKRENTSVSSAFATIIVERVIDVLTLLFLLGLAMIISRDKIMRVLPAEIDQSKLLIIGIMIFAVIIFSFYPPFVRAVLKYTVKPISHKLYDKLSDIFNKFRAGLQVIKTPSQYARLFVESLSIWLLYSIPMYLMFFCFPFHTEIQAKVGDALFLLIAAGIATTIAPTPGGIGVLHIVVQKAMMSMYGLGEADALAYATVNHAVNTFVALALGGYFLFRERMNKIPATSDLVEMEIPTDTESKPNGA